MFGIAILVSKQERAGGRARANILFADVGTISVPRTYTGACATVLGRCLRCLRYLRYLRYLRCLRYLRYLLDPGAVPLKLSGFKLIKTGTCLPGLCPISASPDRAR